jgi:hypothetical protein
MKPSSAKAKGRKLQQYVRDTILDRYPELHPDDVRSTGMGQGGEDVQLSPAARLVIPCTVECKAVARVAAARYYDQAAEHAKGTHYEPIAVFRENHGKALAIVDWEYLLHLLRIRSHGES